MNQNVYKKASALAREQQDSLWKKRIEEVMGKMREEIPAVVPHHNPHLSGYNSAIREAKGLLLDLIERK